MPWKTSDGTYLKEGRSWTDSNGVKHPSNWMIWSEDYKTNTKSPETKSSTERTDPKSFFVESKHPQVIKLQILNLSRELQLG